MMDFMATWSASRTTSQILDDGREMVGNVVLPPYIELLNHVQKIVQGGLLVDRIGGWTAIWEPEDEPFHVAASKWPGELELVGKLGPSRHMEWWISWHIAADADSFGHSGSYMSPTLALAHVIAVCEEHEREVRSEMLELTGGLA